MPIPDPGEPLSIGQLARRTGVPARADGIASGSPDGQAVLHRIIGPDITADQRAALLSQLETFTDARVERYWQLLAIINGQPAPPSVVPVFDWLITALRAS